MYPIYGKLPEISMNSLDISSFTPLLFFLQQRQLPTGLSFNGGVFASPSDQIGNDVAHFSEGSKFGRIIPIEREIEGNVIAHSIQLAEPNAVIIFGKAFFINDLHGQVGTHLVMGSDINRNIVQVL